MCFRWGCRMISKSRSKRGRVACAWGRRFSGREPRRNHRGHGGAQRNIKLMDSVAAKQFLISRVVEEAEFEHKSLSEIEKKMLYFTEVHPSLPDIYEVNEEFERDYDSDEYEKKITALLKSARDRDPKQSPVQEQQWKDAIDSLKNEDHYILVMVDCAFP